MTRSVISVAAQVDEYIDLLDDPREPDGRWHPSSYWGCDRRAVYEVRGEEHSDPFEPVTRRRFALGNLVHSFVREALMTSPEVAKVHAEFDVSRDDRAGRGDLLVELLDGRWLVVEIKSMSKMRPVRIEDIRQGLSYAVEAREHGFIDEAAHGHGRLGDRLAGVLVVYVDKVTMRIREEFVEWSDAWPKMVADRLEHLSRYRDDPRSLPPRLKGTKLGTRNEACFRCPFWTRCRSEKAVEVAA